MAKVTSKRQVTIPKAVADRYRIAAGDEIRFVEAGAAIRVERAEAPVTAVDRKARLARFDQATERQRGRQRSAARAPRGGGRGWRREDLYGRVRAG